MYILMTDLEFPKNGHTHIHLAENFDNILVYSYIYTLLITTKLDGRKY
jgi:hypothetical protein